MSATRQGLEHHQTRSAAALGQLREWVDLVRSAVRREDGQTMTEYGILLALIVVGVVGVLALMGPKIVAAFSYVNAHI